MRYLGLIFCFISIFGFSQDPEITPSELKKMEFSGVYKSSINLEIGGKSGFIGISYDRLFAPKWRFGIGGGYSSAGVDLKFYPYGVKRDKWLLNLGLRTNFIAQSNGNQYLFYSLPIGITHFGLSRINIDFDLGPMWKQPITQAISTETYLGSLNYVWFSVKVGYRFSFYAYRRARQLQ